MDFIKTELIRHGRDVSWLAGKTGYEERSINQWLSGGKEPKVSILIRILAALHLQLSIEEQARREA